MKNTYRSTLITAAIATGMLLTAQLHAQVDEIPSPQPADPEASSETVTLTETDTVVRDDNGNVVASEEDSVTLSPGPERNENIPVTYGGSFYDQYLRDRLTVGTRMLWYSLTDTEQGEEFDGSFLGSINRTTEDQDPAPVFFYLEYAVTPHFGFGVSYDRFKVVTLDNGGGDGTFDLDGPILYGFGRLVNGSIFTPFVELGVAFYGVDFDPLEEWTFSGGSPTVINRFEPDNATGLVLAGGVDIQIIEHLSLNLYLRYVSVDFDVDYFFTPNSTTVPSKTGTFPGDHFAYGFGLGYTF